MELFDNIQQVKNNWHTYRVWEAEQRKNEAIDNLLREKYPPSKDELKIAKHYGQTILGAINVMDKHAIDKTEDVGLVIKNYSTMIYFSSLALGAGLGAFMKRSSLGKRLPDLKPYWELFGMIATSAIASIFSNIWQANAAKQAARLARFHTRENELSDYKNFIIYDNEQQEKAKDIAKNLPKKEIKTGKILDKSNFNFVKVHNLAKKTKDELELDSQLYEEWKDAYTEKEKNKIHRFKEIDNIATKNDFAKAEKERNIILQTIKKIENMSNEYSTNMQMAAFVLSGSITAAGTLIGATISGGIALLKKSFKFSTGTNNVLKGMQLALVTIIPGIATLVAVAPTVKLVKDSARIGRFKAKQELMNNPEKFITYTDEQRKEVSISTPEVPKESFISKFKKDIIAIKKLKNDAIEYYEYLETKYPDEVAMNKALKTLEPTAKQIDEAKKIQQQLFYAFEKTDEKQVSFMEDINATIDIAREVGISIINMGLKILPIYTCAKDVKRINNGKMPENLKEVFKIITSGKLRPITVITLVLPFILPKFLTFYALIKGIQIKKEAGKIGVMSAMQDMEDPRNFIIKNKN